MTFTSEHKQIAQTFRQKCYWNHGVYQTARHICNNEYDKIDFVMDRIGNILKEYWILDVAKLFDKKYSFNDRKFPNLVIDYLIDELPWAESDLSSLSGLKLSMLPLFSKFKWPRNKIIAHNDLETHVNYGVTDFYDGFDECMGDQFYLLT